MTKPGLNNPHGAEFEVLYARHSREVWAAAYARWLNAELAQDIMQEAFLRFWRQQQDGRRIDNPRGWLLRVARNLAEDHGKSAFHRNGTQAPATLDALFGGSDGPVDRAIGGETADLVREELKKLPAMDREILTLRYSLDYSTTEIAEHLEIHPSAVHMRLSRARQRLGERLSEIGVDARE